jgi:hypothetical protein
VREEVSTGAVVATVRLEARVGLECNVS